MQFAKVHNETCKLNFTQSRFGQQIILGVTIKTTTTATTNVSVRIRLTVR